MEKALSNHGLPAGLAGEAAKNAEKPPASAGGLVVAASGSGGAKPAAPAAPAPAPPAAPAAAPPSTK